MANEITAGANLAFAKGEVPQQKIVDLLKQFTVSGSKFHRTVQNVGTSEEAMSLGDIATSALGWCYLRNLGSTNFVKLLAGSGGTAVIKLKSGEFALFRLMTGFTPYLIADTAAVNVEVFLVED